MFAVVGQDRRRVVMDHRDRRRLDHEAMVRVEHDLVAGPEHRVAHQPAVDEAAFGRSQVAQQDRVAAQVDARVAIGERSILDADVGIRGTADEAARP